jgi:hypothetical protein
MAPRDNAFSFTPMTRRNANAGFYTRQTNAQGEEEEDDYDDAFGNYTVSGEDTPYTSRTATCVIRNISETCGEEDATGALSITVDYEEDV